MPSEQTPLQRELFQKHLNEIQDHALNAPGLLLQDAEKIPEEVVSRLWKFTRKTDEQFLHWVGLIVNRYVFFHHIVKTCHLTIHKVISKTLGADAEDARSDVYTSTINKIFDRKLGALKRPSPTGAKLETRVGGITRWECRAWLKTKIREREKAELLSAKHKPAVRRTKARAALHQLDNYF